MGLSGVCSLVGRVVTLRWLLSVSAFAFFVVLRETRKEADICVVVPRFIWFTYRFEIPFTLWQGEVL